MNPVFSPYLSKINAITWHNVDDFVFPSQQVKHWLLESGSLTKRLERHCAHLSVDVLCQKWCDGQLLAENESTLLPDVQQYLLRQVVLNGDQQPWVIGHSLIPQITAQDGECNLADLGCRPLGEKAFNARSIARGDLQVAQLLGEQGDKPEILFARRSRLWVNHNPLLVTELFLPFAPIYRQEKM